MPILKNAKKKLRQDKKRTIQNKKIRDTYKDMVKAAKVGKTEDAVKKAFSSVDKAAKKHLIHKNKASRIKASISRILAAKPLATAKSKGTKSVGSSAAK